MSKFISVSKLEQDDVIKFLFCGYEAVDTERHLALSTTNGRTRNARRWFVTRYNLPSGRTDWKSGKVEFRAWDFAEAMERLNETRITNRIDKQFGKGI